MTDRERDRASYDLPGDAQGVTRWTAARKAEVVRRFDAGEVDLNTILRRYCLTLEEFEAWRQAFRARGRSGLKATKVQEQRQLPGFGS